MKKIITFISVLFCTVSLFSVELDTEGTALSAENAISANDFAANVRVALSNADYMVTAGDVYSLNYAAGTAAISYTIPVDPSYKIRVSNLAVLDAKGKSYIQLKKEVEEIVQKNYPMSGVQFVLLNPASFKVTVKGEVGQTYEQQVWALTRLSSVLRGTSYASYRDVTVTSENGTVRSYDIFKAQRFGDLKQNPYLRPNDVITLNRIDRVVSITGAVERPGSYQLLKGENLKNLIDYYGNGLVAMADLSRMELTRTLNSGEKSGKKIYLEEKNYIEDYELNCYDSIYIPTYSALKPVMFMEGAVGAGSGDDASLESSNRMAVRFENGTNLASLVRSYAGRFSSISDLENAYIIRKDEIIPVDLNPMLYDAAFYSDIQVEADDILRVPFKQFFVTVSGSVAVPGRYPYIPDRTYDYYVALAGGFIKSQNSKEAVEILDMNGNELSKSDVITPESIIRAETNSFTYYFNSYSGIITTILSIASTTLSILAVTDVIGKKN